MNLPVSSSVAMWSLIGVGVVTCAVILYFKTREAVWPYSKKPPLTVVEQRLYHNLCKALPDHIILAQVSLYSILNVDATGDEYFKYFNKISRKSLDFLICKKDFSIVAAIELDDSSHELEERQKADYEKDTALRSAGVRIIRWPVKNFPTIAMIQKDVLNK